jgi:hypothetical protein
MNSNNEIILYGQYYNNCKLHIKNIKSDFDIIRELEKYHKENIKTKIIKLKYENNAETLISFGYSDTLFFVFE